MTLGPAGAGYRLRRVASTARTGPMFTFSSIGRAMVNGSRATADRDLRTRSSIFAVDSRGRAVPTLVSGFVFYQPELPLPTRGRRPSHSRAQAQHRFLGGFEAG